MTDDTASEDSGSAEDILSQSIKRIENEVRRVRADARLHFGLGLFVIVLSATALTYLHLIPTTDYSLEARTRELAGIRDHALMADGQYVACNVNSRAFLQKSLGDVDDEIFSHCSHWLSVAEEIKQKERRLISNEDIYSSFFASGWNNVYKAATNILFIVLLNASAFVFFRTFYSKHREARFYTNEITNLELKIAALRASSTVGDGAHIPHLALVLALSERNFIASGNEKFWYRADEDGEKGLLREISEILRGVRDTNAP